LQNLKGISKYGIITDDVHFASTLTSYLYENGIYLPIISLPRMNRPDWESEVLKRTWTINRANIKYLFCKSKDYGLLAPVRKYANADIVALKKPAHIKRFITLKSERKKISNISDDSIENYLNAIKGECILAKTKENSKQQNNNIVFENKAEALLVLERDNSVTDIAAINYALANGYDIFVIDEVEETLKEEIISCLIKFSDNEYAKNDDNINRLFNILEKKLMYLVDYKSIESKYKRVQFVVRRTYLGVLVEKIPATHLLHLQADLHFLNEYYYLEKYREANDKNIPSFLFVDTQEEGLSSEVPEISENLTEYKNWKFYLNGKNANLLNFRIFSHFFPYDILLMTGHGASPKARIAIFKFKSRNGEEHIAKVLEYYQFGSVIGDKIEVDRKYYPLEFDNISWKDKKLLKRKNLSHIFLEFTLADKDLELVKHEDVSINKIEGIKLYDGVFMGNIDSFEVNNNPIILLNSCGSLVEAGEIVNFGIPRILVGTLWPVMDKDANKFAVDLFESIYDDTILCNFYKAKNKIASKYTKFSYVMLGTLNQYLPMKKSVECIKDVENNMYMRIQNSINEIIKWYYEGYIKKNEIKAVSKYIDVCNKFVESKYPDNHELRRTIKTLRNEFVK
jgi:hypothetical protein